MLRYIQNDCLHFLFHRWPAYINNKAITIFAVNLQTNLCNMRLLNICLFINLFVFSLANAQQNLPLAASKNCTDTNKFFFPIAKYEANLSPVTIGKNKIVKTIPSSYYTNSLSFFCKKELQLEKAVKFPVKMRLGNVTYTDKMEGKITARSTE